MKIYSNHILTIATATITLAGCTASDEVGQELKGRQPIQLTSNIALAQTRGVQDTQLANGEIVYLWAHQMQTADAGTTWSTDWTKGAYINAWQLTSNGSDGFTGDIKYYPDDPLTFMAVHGRNLSITAGTTTIPATVTHTVATDQSAATDLTQSDLLYWGSDNSSAGYRASSTAVNLQFDHKLSKIEIELDATNSDYTAAQLANAVVRLNGILPTVTLNMSTATSGAISAASGDPVTITPHSPSALHYEAIIPPQNTHTGVITVAIDGYTIPVNPNTNFTENTRYQYTITLKNQQATVQSSITAWGDGIAEGDQAIGTKAIPNYDIRKLPLWYVAEKNIDYDSGTYSFATTDNAGYYLQWSTAMKLFTTTANAYADTPTSISTYTNGTGSIIKGWHLPTKNEWLSVIPGDGQDMYDYSHLGGDPSYKVSSLPCVWGYDATTKADIGITDKSYLYGTNDGNIYIIYALRFLGTSYCSIWKYETRNTAPSDTWTDSDNGRLTITARLIDDPVLTNASNFTIDAHAEAVCRDYINKNNWESHFSDLGFTSGTNGNNEGKGAVQRVFFALGRVQDNSGSTYTEYPDNGYYWGATEAESNPTTSARPLHFRKTANKIGGAYNKTYGMYIRLFRDSYDYVAPKTTIATATTSNLAIGDIVCSDGTIYAAANATYVATAHKTPIGIIAYVNDGSAIGDAATEKGLGRFPTKSQGRALVMCLKNSSNGAKWRATNTAFGTSYTSTDASYTTTTFYPGWQRTHDMNSTEFPAAYSAYNFTALTAPSNTTGWFLPSSGQWKLMISKLTPFQALTQEGSWSYNVNHDYTSQYLASLMDAYLAPAGDYDAIRIVDSTEYFYWTSSEYSSDYGSRIDMPKDGTLGFNMLHAARTYSYYVRPILAF